VIPTQILQVLSTIRMYDVRALLMGGQACVLYGAAEYSRALDLAVLATPEALPALRAALEALHAVVIAVPSFDVRYLDRGHAVHFSIPDGSMSPLRVNIMSRLRGVDAFPQLWERRTSIALPTGVGDAEVLVDVMALEDLVAAKKTQRDKHWPRNSRSSVSRPGVAYDRCNRAWRGVPPRSTATAHACRWCADDRSTSRVRRTRRAAGHETGQRRPARRSDPAPPE